MLCPRALGVLGRQLALRTRLEEAGKIDHGHLFFKENGEPIRNLQYLYVRWRRTLARLRTIVSTPLTPFFEAHAPVALVVGKAEPGLLGDEAGRSVAVYSTGSCRFGRMGPFH